MDVPGFIGLESLVLRLWGLVLQIAQVAHPVPAQTAVQTGARGIRVEKLADHCQEVIERNQQRLAQRHRDGLLRRRQRRLQPVRRMAAIFDAVAVTPFVDRLLRGPEPVRQNPRGIIARLDGGADLWCGRCLLVKMDQHRSSPLQVSPKTHLAMKIADRRGSM